MSDLHRLQIEPLIWRALEEDWGYRDWTTDLCVPPGKKSKAVIVAKENLVVSGLETVHEVFRLVDPDLTLTLLVENGQEVEPGAELLNLQGSAQAILKGERVALNFLGRLCGIASHTRQYVKKLEGLKTQLLDTRKTTPGLRILEKSATMVGGARNHRFGLCDGVMVKENHIRAAGGITKALESLLESLAPTIKVEVETTNLDEVEEAVRAGADIIMLDNMPLEMMKDAVKLVRGRVLLEASGNVRLETIRDVALCGVDFISTSAIITRAPWADLSLLFDRE